ncbi:DUF4231 domain-containing protein [Methylorubrum sp. SB2]|uniref:DUF4231 domain-containing protein n=1 Tax=Methylorubrum subtropicum TaxID=3138812 RepID=UPI00313EE105
MNEADYPALYQSSNAQSAQSQNWSIYALLSNFACIVISSILSTINYPSSIFAIFQTVILLIGLCITIYLAIGKPQQSWYGTRALAESIKTITWRYMTRAEPYNVPDADADRNFLSNLKVLVSTNHQLTSSTLPVSNAEEITSKMREIRNNSLVERVKLYMDSRVEDQRKWYISKSSYNKTMSRVWLSVIILVYILLIGFAVARPAFPDYSYWPTDVLLTLASSFLAWTQTKRYQELAASYALTAHEISLLKATAITHFSEEQFSVFVSDAENAFSREHTQWQARRDHE